MKGRASSGNLHNRFAHTRTEVIDDGWGDLPGAIYARATEAIARDVRSLISYNQSPDIPFSRSINPYQGCEHGCIYCYARPSHAYLDFSPGLDFETRIIVKQNAATILRKELAAGSYHCDVIALGANTDAYQPLERQFGLTRKILEVLLETRHPVAIVTKSSLIERDLDLLQEMARDNLVEVFITVETLDRELARLMDPRATAPQRRLQTIAALAAAGVPVGVMTAPVIPALTDPDMEKILQQAAESGASMAGYVLLRLPLEVNPLFEQWLQQHYPLRAAHVLSLIEQSRQGARNDPAFGSRMRGSGVFADLLRQRFRLACSKYQLNSRNNLRQLDTDKFIPPRAPTPQLQLF